MTRALEARGPWVNRPFQPPRVVLTAGTSETRRARFVGADGRVVLAHTIRRVPDDRFRGHWVDRGTAEEIHRGAPQSVDRCESHAGHGVALAPCCCSLRAPQAITTTPRPRVRAQVSARAPTGTRARQA